jgi:ribulose-5-phosphate 4-epimerase/fuculose-1-phosphate aldolase
MTTTNLGSCLDELVEAGRRLSDLGLSPGTSGNISVRDDDQIFLSPTGSSMGSLTVDELAIIDLAGTRIGGSRPSKEHPLHRAFYRRDSATRAVVHLHSPSATAVSCLESWSPWSALPPITPYFVMRVGQTPRIPYAHPGDPAQAAVIEALDLPFRAVLLQNHGLVVAGESATQAADCAIELEEACKLLLLLGGREVEHLSASQAAHLATTYGSHWTDEG